MQASQLVQIAQENFIWDDKDVTVIVEHTMNKYDLEDCSYWDAVDMLDDAACDLVKGVI